MGLKPTRPRRPRLWTLVAALLLGMLLGPLLFLFSLQLAGVNVPSRNGMDTVRQLAMDQPIWNLIEVLTFCAGMLAAVVIAAKQSPMPFRERLGLVRGTLPVRAYPWVLLGGVCLDGLSLSIITVLQALGVSFPENEDMTRSLQAIARADWPLRVTYIVCLGVLPGVVEEVFFRGYIQRRLLERWRPGPVIGLLAIGFSLLHAWGFVFVLAGSWWLGYVAWRTGSIWPGVPFHAVVNSASAALFMHHAFVVPPRPGSPELRDDAVYAMLAIVPLALLFRLAWRRISRTPLGTPPHKVPAADGVLIPAS